MFNKRSERSAFGQGMLANKMGFDKDKNPFEDDPEALVNKYEEWNEGWDNWEGGKEPEGNIPPKHMKEFPLYESGLNE